MTIESPCILLCRLDPSSGLCTGCGRSGAEIGAWLSYTPEERRAIMAVLPARLAANAPADVTARSR